MKSFNFIILLTFLFVLTACTKSYIVTFNASDGGSVSNMGGEYDEGMVVSVSATPDTGYEFLEWSDGSLENPRKIIVSNHLSLTALFGLKELSVNVNIEGEGTVSVSGDSGQGTFEYGSTASFEATPADGWEFVSWSGDVESRENPLKVTITEAKSITAIFIKSNYTVKFIPINNLPEGDFGFAVHSVHYKFNGKEYILGGGVNWSDPNHYRPPLVQLLRTEDSWEVINVFQNVDMSEIRHHEFSSDGRYILIADHGPEWPDKEWPFSHVYIGELIEDNILWRKVSDNPSFYHDASFGDINGDGLIDVVGGHMGTRNGNGDNPHLYYGLNNGEFKEAVNVLPNPPEGGCCGDVEVYDLNQNGENEIIRIGGSVNREVMDALEYNSETESFDIVFSLEKDIPENYVNTAYTNLKLTSFNDESYYRGYMPSNNRFKDFNGDGLIDFINEKDGLTIWYNNGNMQFSPFRLNKQAEDNTGLGIWNDYYLMAGQDYFDIENDGDLDIVTRTSTLGIPPLNEGIKIDNVIYINDAGEFKRLSDSNYFVPNEDLKDNYPCCMFIPFLRDGYLSFIGYTSDNTGEGPFPVMLEIETDIPASYWYD